MKREIHEGLQEETRKSSTEKNRPDTHTEDLIRKSIQSENYLKKIDQFIYRATGNLMIYLIKQKDKVGFYVAYNRKSKKIFLLHSETILELLRKDKKWKEKLEA